MRWWGVGGRVRPPQMSQSRVRLAVAGLAAAGLAGGGLVAWTGPAIADTTCQSNSSGTVLCTFTGGAQYWTVPTGVAQAQFFVFGAEGGPAGPGASSVPGMGGEVSAVLPVSPGEVLQVNVGRAGVTNQPQVLFAGGVSLAGSGGGASDVRSPAADGSYPLENRLLVAGGGGGAGGAGADAAPGAATPAGGSGGNADSDGSPGMSVNTVMGPVPPGGVLSGGQGGFLADTNAAAEGGMAAGSQPCASTPGASGAVGNLGAGGGSFTEGGGGGGGYFGGNQGGAGASDSCGYAAGAGGGSGGSSYPAADVVTDATLAPRSWPLPWELGGGDQNGEVIIVFTASSPTAPQVLTASLPSAVAGTPYSATLAGSGGTPPYTWSLGSGTLPDGLTLSSDGTISGTPTTAATSDFTVQLTDSAMPSGLTATQQLSITVSEAAPVFTADSPPLTSAAAATYQYQFAATDAASWSLSSDAPSWLTVSGSGLVSGTPPAGTSSFTYSVTAANSTGSATAGPYAVAVSTPAPDLQVTDAATPHLVVSGKQLIYTITAANTGSAGAAAVVVTDTLPASVHFVSAVSTQGTCTQASSGNNKNKGVTVTCKGNAPLAAGATVTVTITVKATTPGTITDKAGVTANGVTADSDDSATTTVTVQGT